MVKYVFIATANIMFIVGALNLMGFRVNTTKSYPEGVYRLVSSEWEYRDLVEVCLPKMIKDIAIENGYLNDEGRCGGHPPIIKKVAAVGGDFIEITDVVSINGEVLDNSMLMTSDASGLKLLPAKGGTVESGYVWLMSTVTDISFDSRYFGAIEERYIIGKLEPVWTY